MATSPEPEKRQPAFAELHAVSNFTFLRGASHPEELVKRAHDLGYAAIAITDECSVAGAVRAHMAAKACEENGHGIDLIVGAEFHLASNKGIRGAPATRSGCSMGGERGRARAFSRGARGGTPRKRKSGAEGAGRGALAEDIHLVLLAPSRLAYGQLGALITKARRRSPKGEYALGLEDLGGAVDACFALWIPGLKPIGELMAEGRLLSARLPQLWIALEVFLEPTDLDKTANALTLATRLDLPIVASNDTHMHASHRKPLQDLLTAIANRTTVAELGTAAQANGERYLRPIERLLELYPEEMLDESVGIARRCRFSLDELRYEYPAELVPPGVEASEHLRQLVNEGAAERWPDGVPEDVTALVEKELKLVKSLGYEHFFLTVHDIVRYARTLAILCQGRGSAANSAICYCLHITEVDPSRMHMLFERFISKERDEPPDIDVDFEHERREEVIQYIYRRYGRERAALAATLITYRPRSAIRDVGKALGLDLDLVDLLAKSMAWWDKGEALDARLAAAGIDPKSKVVRQFVHLVNEILGFPRHLSQHVGGFVISQGPLSELVPIENAAMADRTVIQWDKNDLEALGLLKVDVLGLGMLTAIRKTLDLVNDFRGGSLTVNQIPPERPEVYEMLQRADSMGVFQVESRAQMSMLPRLRPECFYDLVVEVAIVRPGPIQGNMVHPYLRRRQGLEPVTYSNEAVRKVLDRTLGVPIFQEQVIELAMVAAGFTAGEADQLRRAMAAWHRRGGLEHFEQKLIRGMLERGHDQEFAERIFEQIKGFGEYGFPESHSSSFALLVYVSAWLKRFEPSGFYCGLLNSLPMGFYSPSQLVQDAAAHGIEVREADVQTSGWDYRLEPSDADREATGRLRFEAPLAPQPAIRLGLRQVKGLSQATADRIAAAQPFTDANDLRRRAALDKRDLDFLARAGALGQLSGHRYQAHWDAAGLDNPAAIWSAAEAHAPYRTRVRLDGPAAGEDAMADYRYLGLTLGPHPMSLLREDRAFRHCRSAAELAGFHNDQFVQVAGIVTCRQRPGSASGVIFMTLEDETGNSNIVVWSSVLERFRAALLQGRLLAIKGVVEREGEVIHVVAGRVRDLTHKLAGLSRRDTEDSAFASRNFH